MLDLYLKRNFYSPTSQHFSFICKSLLPLFSNNHNRWVGIFHTLILSFAQQAHDKCTEHIHETKTWMRNSHGCYIAFFFYFNISSRNAFEVWQIIWIFDIWIWSTVDVACIICSKHTHTHDITSCMVEAGCLCWKNIQYSAVINYKQTV